MGAILAKRTLDADEVGWLRLQWYGPQPKQWFCNAHQVFHWPQPRFSHADQTVVTPVHLCTVALPPAVAKRIHSNQPVMASAPTKKEAEALCALKGCWLMDVAGFLARNNGKASTRGAQPHARALPPPPSELLLGIPAELMAVLQAALEGVHADWLGNRPTAAPTLPAAWYKVSSHVSCVHRAVPLRAAWCP